MVVFVGYVNFCEFSPCVRNVSPSEDRSPFVTSGDVTRRNRVPEVCLSEFPFFQSRGKVTLTCVLVVGEGRVRFSHRFLFWRMVFVVARNACVLPLNVPRRPISLGIRLLRNDLRHFFFHVEVSVREFAVQTRRLFINRPRFVVRRRHVSKCSCRATCGRFPVTRQHLEET